MSTYYEELEKSYGTKGLPAHMAFTQACAEVDRLRTDLAAAHSRLVAVEAERAGAEAVIHSIDCEVDGYVDGAPDCNAVSKLANAVHNIIHTEGTRYSAARERKVQP